MSAEIEFAPSGFAAAEPPARPAGNLAAATLRFGSLIAFAAILAIFSLTAPYFLSIGNIGNVLGQSAISGVLAIGLTVVLIAGGSNVVTGGIDLSLAANMGLSAAVYASLTQLGYGDATAITAALLTGALIGTVNAVAVVYAGIVPLPIAAALWAATQQRSAARDDPGGDRQRPRDLTTAAARARNGIGSIEPAPD